jgi:hypothetical protein
MQKVSYTTPIPRSGQSLLTDFADVKLKNKFNDLSQKTATAIYKVGTDEGVVEVPFLPGWIYMRAVYPDGTTTLEKCYVPTYDDGSTKVLFEPDQIITPRRSSDTQPTYWIYDGIPPTPITKTLYLAQTFDTSGINSAAFDSLGQIVNDEYLPSTVNVDRMLDGTPSEMTWRMTDTGQRSSDGQRLWNVTYTGTDFNTDTSDAGYLQVQADGSKSFVPPAPTAPLPPTGHVALTRLFDPCNPEECPPSDPNYPNCDPNVPGRPIAGLPVHNPTIPKIPAKTSVCPQGYKKNSSGGCDPAPAAKPPNKTNKPPNGFRLPPNQPPGKRPPERPYIPPTPPTNPPGPPTGPGLPPPGGGGDGGGGGSWDDDGDYVTGCFGIPFKLDERIIFSNDGTDPNAVGSLLERAYYNIRDQIDAAISALVSDGTYRQKGLIWVSLLFDGINEEQTTLTTSGVPHVTNKDWYVPRVYRTKYVANVATDSETYFHGPTSLFNDTATTLPYQQFNTAIPPDASLNSHYRLWDFDGVTIGSDSDPVGCDPLHYSYRMNALPAYSADLLEMLADHPGYRLYISCFKYLKTVAIPHQLPYEHDFSGGDFDGWIGFGDDGPLGRAIGRRGAIEGYGPFQSPKWIKGFTVTITGWSDMADDLFNNTTLANGVLIFSVLANGSIVGSRSKNMYHPYSNHADYYKDKPDTFTWSFDLSNTYSPCTDWGFTVGGGNIINSIWMLKIKIDPIFAAAPTAGTPNPTGPNSGPGGGGAPPTDPNAPRNPGPNPIPAGSPVGPPFNPAAGPGDDGGAAPKQKPAFGGSGGSGPSPATGIAPKAVPANEPVNAQSSGSVGGYSGFTPGGPVYLDPVTPGAVTQTKPTCSGCLVQQLGVASDSTTLQVDIGPAVQRI